jgi:REP element-mobilizing transposase RayT
MANTYTSLTYHVIFSTKNREPVLDECTRERLWPYLGGIARENGMRALETGGALDHMHILLSIPPTLAVSKAIQLIKGGSSHWVKSRFPKLASFAWQDGYAALTVSQSNIDAVRRYIRDQAEHHRKRTFLQEYRALLKRHQIAFDEKYLLG